MTDTAIIFMVISMMLIWGGLVASAVSLFKHPEAADDEPMPPTEL